MKSDDPNVGPVVVTAEQLEERIAALGKEITADYQGRAPLLVGVLKGAFMFMSDLDLDLSGRHVILVEDIVDSGLTLSYVRKNLLARGPASLEVCALLVREGLQKRDPELRYVGFHIPPEFVIGERYRNLPFVCVYAGPDPSVP